MCFPYANQTQIERVQRLIFDLTEFSKPYDERDPEIQRMLPPYPDRAGHLVFTKFNMNLVYCGKQGTNGDWRIACVHLVGLAAFDPWFSELRPSFITHPHDYDTLDVCGVTMLGHDGLVWKRVTIYDSWVSEFFGFGPTDWESLIDSTQYFEEFLAIGASVRPWMVLRRLYKLTQRSHGTIDPILKEKGTQTPSPLDLPKSRVPDSISTQPVPAL